MTLPLAGIRLLEAYSAEAPEALRLAGGFAGRLAADLGAEVIRIDPAGRVSDFLDAGKKLTRAEVVPAADVVIHDLGWSGEVSAPIRAGLSMLPESSADFPASEFTLMALGGLLDIVGDPARAPLKLGGHQGAYATGLSAFTAISACMCRCDADGRLMPETIRVSLMETIVWLNWKCVPHVEGFAPLPTRAGNAAEWQILKCADGFVALVYQEGDWANLLRLIGDARLAAPDFATRPQRLPRLGDIARIAEEVFAGLTRREIHRRALEFRLPLGPVWSTEELKTDPHYRARDAMVVTEGGGLRPGLPILWGGIRPAMPEAEARVA